MELPDKVYFRIGEVARIVGVETHVLRYWESEFRLRPHRSSSGQRLYRKQDVARFLRVRQLLHEEGFTIAGARKLLLDGGGASEPTLSKGVPTGHELLDDALAHVRAARQRLSAFVRDLGD